MNLIINKRMMREMVDKNYYENVKEPRLWKYYEDLIQNKRATKFVSDVLKEVYPKYKLQGKIPVWLIRGINEHNAIYQLHLVNYLIAITLDTLHDFKGKKSTRKKLFFLLCEKNLEPVEIYGEIISFYNETLNNRNKNQLINTLDLNQYVVKYALNRLISQEIELPIRKVNKAPLYYNYNHHKIILWLNFLFKYQRQLYNQIKQQLEKIIKSKLSRCDKETIIELLNFASSHYIYTGKRSPVSVKIWTSLLKIIGQSLRKWGMRLING